MVGEIIIIEDGQTDSHRYKQNYVRNFFRMKILLITGPIVFYFLGKLPTIHTMILGCLQKNVKHPFPLPFHLKKTRKPRKYYVKLKRKLQCIAR